MSKEELIKGFVVIAMILCFLTWGATVVFTTPHDYTIQWIMTYRHPTYQMRISHRTWWYFKEAIRETPYI
jgi:hypothetical protein